jgi:non-homologous end joining protein Ku
VCSSCLKELSSDEIKKALEVGEELKQIDTDKIKIENSSLRVLGLIDEDTENGVFFDGLVWFVGIPSEKVKDKFNRNVLKFSYLRETLRESKKTILGLIAVRGKEHIVVIKPYFNGLVCQGVYPLSQIRDIKEISNYSENTQIDKNIIYQMVEQIKLKEKISLKSIENKRDLLIEKAIENISPEPKKEENPIELMSF